MVKEQFTEKRPNSSCCTLVAKCKSTISHSCNKGNTVMGGTEFLKCIKLSFCCT